jgi:hypothetical protein
MRGTCPPISPSLISWRGEYIMKPFIIQFSASSCDFHSVLALNIFFCTLFLKAYNLHFSVHVRDHAKHSYEAQHKSSHMMCWLIPQHPKTLLFFLCLNIGSMLLYFMKSKSYSERYTSTMDTSIISLKARKMYCDFYSLCCSIRITCRNITSPHTKKFVLKLEQ